MIRFPMVAYMLVMYGIQASWCFLGLRRLSQTVLRNVLPASLAYGVVRILIGRSMVFLLQDHLTGVPGLAVYAFVVLPLRWLAWSLMAQLVATGQIPLRGMLVGTRDSNLWRLGGMILSGIADLLALLAGLHADEIWP